MAVLGLACGVAACDPATPTPGPTSASPSTAPTSSTTDIGPTLTVKKTTFRPRYRLNGTTAASDAVRIRIPGELEFVRAVAPGIRVSQGRLLGRLRIPAQLRTQLTRDA